ncbi:MAG: hypothetical protein A3K09_07965 [Nitrospinae bacterium RIFCSPLOWO2_12_FULL_47_7]|nr:MAG: hypothetical protein A3K09_07965 [Nitrospinae bacterium RIFCSPLOWO2_12_FULL_47_7]
MRVLSRHIKTLSVALLVLTGSPAYSAASVSTVVAVPKTVDTAATEQTDLAEKLLAASGLKKQLLNMSASTILNKSRMEFLGLSREENTIIGNIYSRVFRSEIHYQNVSRVFAKGINTPHFSPLVQWFSSPLGKKIIQLESAFQSMSSSQKEEKTTGLLASSFPSEERLALIEKLEKNMDSTNLDITLVQLQIQGLAPLGAEFKKNVAEALLTDLKEKVWTQPVHEKILLALLYTYQELSDQELSSYVDFAESAPGQWFFHTKKKALIEAQSRLADPVTNQVKTLLETIQSGKGDREAIQAVLPVGTRYLFAQSRDPFLPLSQVKRESAKIKFSRVLLETKKKADRPKVLRFGAELKVLNVIPLDLYNRLKEKNPALHRDLEKYASMFKEQTELLAMDEGDYLDVIAEYKNLINLANKMAGEIILNTPLQVEYASLKPTGVVWKKKEPIALIETNDKLGYTARKGTLIGPDYGKIESIDQNKIVVVERKRDFKGTILSKTKELEFNVTK